LHLEARSFYFDDRERIVNGLTDRWFFFLSMNFKYSQATVALAKRGVNGDARIRAKAWNGSLADRQGAVDRLRRFREISMGNIRWSPCCCPA
jgi:hypothetical protein